MSGPAILLALLAALWAAPDARAAGAGAPGGAGAWRMPLEAPSVAARFAFDPRRPFAAGQRRVVALAGRPGEPVRSPCPGPVSFAGSLPSGRGVSVRCGRLSATLTGLGAVNARRGDVLAGGQPVGRLGPGGRLFLGARLRAERHGYLDPFALLAPVSGPAPLAPVLRPGRPLRPNPRPERPPKASFPLAAVLLAGAWLGLGVAGSAVGLGIALRGAGPVRRPTRQPRPAGR
ncbi:MAG: hypothetical protein ACKOTH_04790 [Solirubrobacterales bacterium]